MSFFVWRVTVWEALRWRPVVSILVLLCCFGASVHAREAYEMGHRRVGWGRRGEGVEGEGRGTDRWLHVVKRDA